MISLCCENNKDTFTYTCTIKYISIEGGFYGIVTDDDIKYDPINLDEEFKKDGLRVLFTLKTLKDRMSFRMWGDMIEIIRIEKL